MAEVMSPAQAAALKAAQSQEGQAKRDFGRLVLVANPSPDQAARRREAAAILEGAGEDLAGLTARAIQRRAQKVSHAERVREALEGRADLDDGQRDELAKALRTLARYSGGVPDYARQLAAKAPAAATAPSRARASHSASASTSRSSRGAGRGGWALPLLGVLTVLVLGAAGVWAVLERRQPAEEPTPEVVEAAP